MTDLAARQAAAGRQGAAFHAAARTKLQIEGWRIVREKWRHPEVDVEVDIVAVDPQGQEWWIECKGSWEGTRPGLARTDTLMKALFSGALLRLTTDNKPFMVFASHPPKDGNCGAVWLERAEGTYIDRVRYL